MTASDFKNGRAARDRTTARGHAGCAHAVIVIISRRHSDGLRRRRRRFNMNRVVVWPWWPQPEVRPPSGVPERVDSKKNSVADRRDWPSGGSGLRPPLVVRATAQADLLVVRVRLGVTTSTAAASESESEFTVAFALISRVRIHAPRHRRVPPRDNWKSKAAAAPAGRRPRGPGGAKRPIG